MEELGTNRMRDVNVNACVSPQDAVSDQSDPESGSKSDLSFLRETLEHMAPERLSPDDWGQSVETYEYWSSEEGQIRLRAIQERVLQKLRAKLLTGEGKTMMSNVSLAPSVPEQEKFPVKDGFESRLPHCVESKVIIGEYIAHCLRGPDYCGQALGFDGGTTTLEAARAIGRDVLDVAIPTPAVGTIVTNNLEIPQVVPCADTRVLLTGGRLRQDRKTLWGDLAVLSLDQFGFAACVIGGNGFDLEGRAQVPCLFTQTGQEDRVKRKFMARSKTIFIAIDPSKFGKNGGSRVARLKQEVDEKDKKVVIVTARLSDQTIEQFPSEKSKEAAKLPGWYENIAEVVNRLAITWRSGIVVRLAPVSAVSTVKHRITFDVFPTIEKDALKKCGLVDACQEVLGGRLGSRDLAIAIELFQNGRRPSERQDRILETADDDSEE